MIQLILVFCLSAGPHTCKEVQPLIDGIDSPERCLRSAQTIAASELNSRFDLAGYQLSSWRCIAGQQPERRI